MFDYSLNGTHIESSTCEKDIGVYITHDLKPSTHCSKAASKANAVLGIMARNFHYRDKKVWIKLYKTYVRPHLEFASPAWNPWLSKDIKVLEKVQERAVKMCSGLQSPTYEGKLLELGLDTLVTRRKKLDLTQIWKILHKYDNIDEGLYFARMQEGAQRFTRLAQSMYNLRPKNANLDVRRYAFSNRQINAWNSLPDIVKSAPKIGAFRHRLNRHFSGI